LKLRAKHILLSHEYEAKDVLKKLEQGESFEQLAKDFSQCNSAKNGGDLGEFSQGRMVSSFEKALLKLEKNQISGIIKSPFGYHIIKRL